MLNASAKEFVPAPSPRCGPAAPPPLKDCGTCIKLSHADSHAGSGAGRDSLSGSKVQLSPKAAEFVPRGCLVDTASDPPRSVLTPPRSDSTLSSSVVSREADVWGHEDWNGAGEWYEQPEQSGTMSYGNGDGVDGYCYYYSEQGQLGKGYKGCGGYGVASVVPGGELIPEDATGVIGYDVYSCGMYTSYPYDDSGGDVSVYYDAQYAYDGTSSPLPYESTYSHGTYYWDETTGSYVYTCDDTAVYGGWQQQDQLYQGLQAGDDTAATWPSYGDDTGDVAACAADADTELNLVGEELRSLAPSDAAELLEMFFPHYAGDALSSLLQRTSSDMLAAFAELAAMERQLGVERAAAAAVGKGAYGRGGNGKGGKASGSTGRANGRRSGGGSGGAAAFKLDMESFPSLPPPRSPTPPGSGSGSGRASPPAAAASAAAAAEGAAAAPRAATAERELRGPQPSSSDPATTTLSTAASAPALAPAAASTANTAKPDFAALLRSSPSVQSPAPRGTAATATDGDCGANHPCQAGLGARAAARGTSLRAAAPPSSSSAAVPRVTTGEAVSSQYAEERQEAALLARARNQCFQQATMAYLSGNKALAKQLGCRGRELNEAMKAAHAAAARRIFAQRNGLTAGGSPHTARRQQQQQPRQRQAPSGGRGRSGGDEAGAGEALFVDLHGLHAAEAVAVLETQIAAARAAGYRLLRVCTGTGAHTKGAKTPARLPTAVADALLSNHLTFRTLKPGLLEAQL